MKIQKAKFGAIELSEAKFPIEYFKDNTRHYFPRIRNFANSIILESKDVSSVYGRLSLIAFDPVLKISGKDESFEIELMNPRGEVFFHNLKESDFPKAINFKKTAKKITATIKKEVGFFSEEKRTKKSTIADSMRIMIEKYKTAKKTFCGLYGAFSYDFVRLYEDLPNLAKDRGTPDFSFYLYDSFLYFDHLREKADLILYRQPEDELNQDYEKISSLFKNEKIAQTKFKISNASFDIEKEEFTDLVKDAKELARQGELFEVVFSRSLNTDFSGDTFALYEKYRELNPSPYMFYFDFGDGEYLVGASPEMMLRVEDGLAHTRPISGTMPRGKNVIEDHENTIKLLSSEKERSELDMLIDLGRNDLARICEPGVELKEYRTVENYSRVMHTVAHVTGKLKKGFSALDAYIATANAGTLTGAPKVAAMTEIEKHEKTRRGFYGGGVGYLPFSGDMDTGIIIRTAHIKNGKLELRAGATLLYDSDPESEFHETTNKARAFLDVFMKEK